MYVLCFPHSVANDDDIQLFACVNNTLHIWYMSHMYSTKQINTLYYASSIFMHHYGVPFIEIHSLKLMLT